MRWRWWIPFVTGPLGAVLGLTTAGVFAYVTPKKYESLAVVQVEAARAGDGPVMGTEMQVIQAAKTLELAAERLDLGQRWAVDPQQAVEILRSSIAVNQIRGTDLLVIRARHTNPVDARDIAAGVVQAYGERRTAAERQPAEERSEARKPVTLHEEPSLPTRPVAPNPPLMLAVGLLGGAGAGLAIGLLLMCLAARRPPHDIHVS